MSLLPSLIWAPLLPSWLLIALSILAMAIGLYGAIRRVRGLIFRAAAALLALLWLANPQKIHSQLKTQPQDVLLVTDISPSMAIGTRQKLVQNAVTQLTAQAHHLPGVTIHTLDVAGGEGQGTRLFEAIDRASLSLSNLASVFLLTDGMDHDTPPQLPSSLKTSSGQLLPLHLLLAAKGEETDRRLRVLSAPPYVIIGQAAHIRVQVDDLGTTPGQPVDIMEHHNNGQALLLAHTVSGKPVDLTIPVTHAGQTLKEIFATPLAGEISLRNNSTIIHLQGVRDRLRVLLVSGIPNQGARVWRTLLKADPSVDLVHFTILRSPDTEDDTPLSDLALIPFPTHELFAQKIDSFDLIILDGFRNQNILPEAYLENIAHYVRKGGGLLVVGGPEMTQEGSLQNTAVRNILPARVPYHSTIITRAFSPQRTILGLSHPVTSALPQTGPWGQVWGPWYRALPADQIQGETLLSTPSGSPLLILSHRGQGRVAMLLSDQIWLWSRGEKGGGPQAELLRRLSHWLMKEPELEENRLDTHIENNQLVVERYSLETLQNAQATITSPTGQRSHLTLAPSSQKGLLIGRMTLPALEEHAGRIWSIHQNGLNSFAAAQEHDPLENQDLRSTATRLASLIRQSGGGIFWLGSGSVPQIRQVPAGLSLHGEGWAGLPLQQTRVVLHNQTAPFLSGWLLLTLILAGLALGWWREGR